MTKNVAAVLLTHRPTQERLRDISKYVADQHFPEEEYSYTLSETLPENLPEETTAHLTQQKSVEPNSVYLIVRPV